MVETTQTAVVWYSSIIIWAHLATMVMGIAAFGTLIFSGIQLHFARIEKRKADDALDRAQKLEASLVEQRNSSILYSIIGLKIQQSTAQKLGFYKPGGGQFIEDLVKSLTDSMGPNAVVDDAAEALIRTMFTDEEVDEIFKRKE